MSSLNIASRALATNLAALQVVGNNIANVNTPGYSRQSVQLTTAPGQAKSNGYFGKGVEMTGVGRAVDAQLTREAQLSRSVASSDAVRYNRLQQMEALFPLGDSSMGVSLNNAINAWSAIASSPTDTTARMVALTRAEELTGRLRSVSANLDELRLSATEQMQKSASAVNTIAAQIADLNQRIMESQGGNRAPNDLLDQRDQLVAELNTYVQATTVEDSNGRMAVFVGGSQPLVLGSKSGTVLVQKDPMDGQRLSLSIEQAGQSFKLSNELLPAGEIKGLLTFVNNDLAETMNDIGRLTLSLASQMNAQHRLGLDLNGNPGGDLFSLSAIPTAVGLQSDGVTPATATVSATVSDPTAFVASDYELRYDGSAWSVTRSKDGATVASGLTTLPATVDGLTFDATGTPAAGDRYVIRPFSDAARNISVAIAKPEYLAAASPVLVTANSANTGGLTIESLTPTAAGPYATTTLAYDAASGRFNVDGGPTQIPAAPAQYSPGEPLEYGGWSITLRGTPADGDSMVIRPPLAGEAQQSFGNAKAMLNLRDVDSFGGVTLGDGYVNVFSSVAGKVQSAKLSAEFSNTAAINTETALASRVGVNLDEEAARLLQFQQAYQAAAKFLQVAQGTFDTLIRSFN